VSAVSNRPWRLRQQRSSCWSRGDKSQRESRLDVYAGGIGWRQDTYLHLKDAQGKPTGVVQVSDRQSTT